jgi:dTDP-4-amino-4,6-dideoxygalactose transaminase
VDYVIPFNKPFRSGNELDYVSQAVTAGDISGDGEFTKRCSTLLETQFGIKKVLLTPSCTAALEMSIMILGIDAGDEVIMPSFTFVSTANAVVRAGATPVFVDVDCRTLNIDPACIRAAITERTRAIIPVHYAGVGCNMDAIMEIAAEYKLQVIEDAAQGVNARHRSQTLGTIGDLGAYSFHQTKNFSCGEGGALCINDEALIERAEIVREKGTNRSQFLQGTVDKYTWVDVGSSYLPSELTAAFLLGQLEAVDTITQQRRECYQRYMDSLQGLAEAGKMTLPSIPDTCRSNYHLFHILVPTPQQRQGLISRLNEQGIHAVFHYVPLHSSPMGIALNSEQPALPVTESCSERLVRLPIYPGLTTEQQDRIVAEVQAFL